MPVCTVDCWAKAPSRPGWRRWWRSAAIFFALCLISACASRPESGFLLPVSKVAEGSQAHTLLIATTRERDPRPGTLFSGERASALDFASLDISVPASHVVGEVELPAAPPGNPETDFTVRKAAYLDNEAAFVASLNAQLAQRPKGQRRVLLFIHGYNTLFAEALYRFAQVSHDSGSRAVPVLFTWASRGKVPQYVYDNNSATAARDDLEHVIRMLFASHAEEVNIMAHSMGNWVTVEALRQIRLTGHLSNSGKLGNIILAAPDIDVDVFKSQLRRFGRPSKPFFVVLSKDDRALGISTFLAGGKARLGADANVAELTALGAIVIDLTDVKGEDASNHGKFAQLAAIAPQIRAVLARGIGSNGDSASPQQGASGTGLGPIVDTPLAILGAPVRIITGR